MMTFERHDLERHRESRHALCRSLILLSVFCAVIFGRSATAQIAEIVPGTTGMTPEATAAAQQSSARFDALGLRLGSIQIFSAMDVEEIYNSNIYATEAAERSDFITALRPSIAARSNWTNHSLNLAATSTIKRYASNTEEDFANYSIGANGRLDVLHNTFATGGIGFQVAHEERTSPDSLASQKSPTKYKTVSGRLGFVRDVGRIALRIDSGVDSSSYYDSITRTGVVVDQKYRDRVEYRVIPRVSYKVSERYKVFVQAPLNKRRYKRLATTSGVDRTSTGFEIDAGAAVTLTGKLDGDLFVGYLEQNYPKPQRSVTSDLSFGGSLLWSATPLTTAKATLSRVVAETTVGSATGFLQTSGNLGVDHLLRDNVIMNVGAGYTIQDYKGAPRRDRIAEAVLGARYLLSRYATAGVSTTYRRRTSDFLGGGYTQFTLAATLRLQY